MECIKCGNPMQRKIRNSEEVWGNYRLQVIGLTSFYCPVCDREVKPEKETRWLDELRLTLSNGNKPDKVDIVVKYL